MAVQGLIDDLDVLANLKVIDMSDQIAELEPNEAPLTVLLMKLAKENATNSKFEWMEQRFRPTWTKINNGAGYASGVTSIVVLDSTIFAVGDNLKVPRTGEVLRVTANNTGTNTLTVTRGYGETAAAALNDQDWVLNLLNASAQGSTAPTAVSQQPTALYNLTEIIRTPVQVAKTMAATKVYGGVSERVRLQRQAGIDHRKAIEYKMLFGERKEDTSGTSPVRTTRGLVKWLTSNNKDVSATGILTEYDFDKWTEDLFRYGTPKRTLLASSRLLTVINQWAKSKMDFTQDASTYGIGVFTYITPHGQLNIIKHKLLENAYSGYGLVVDLNQIKYKPLVANGENRDTQLLLNRQANDADFYLDEYLTEFGVECRLPENHGVILGVAG
jgi:hypothetical protein